MINDYEIVIRLILASVLGGLIGLEREVNNRPAGLRTHVLVTVGSALVMLISMYGFNGFGVGGTGGEPARLAAQVVSGIGFLGAGTILRQGNSIQGLTTAASLWVSGGIGLAIGNGYYLGGFVTAGIVLFSLVSLGMLEKRAFRKKYKTLHVVSSERPGLIGEIGTLFGINNISIKNIEISPFSEEEDSDLHIDFVIKIPLDFSPDNLFANLSRIQGIRCANWEGELEVRTGKKS